MLGDALRDQVPSSDLDLPVETFRSTVEGTFAKGLDPRARRHVLRFALDRLMTPRG